MTPSRAPTSSRAELVARGSPRRPLAHRVGRLADWDRRTPRLLVHEGRHGATARRPSRPPVGRRRARTRTSHGGDAHRRLLRRQVGGACARATRPRRTAPTRRRSRCGSPAPRRAARTPACAARAAAHRAATAPLSRSSPVAPLTAAILDAAAHAEEDRRRPRLVGRAADASGPRYYVKSGAPSGAVSGTSSPVPGHMTMAYQFGGGGDDDDYDDDEANRRRAASGGGSPA